MYPQIKHKARKINRASLTRNAYLRGRRFTRRDLILTLASLGLIYLLYTSAWTSSSSPSSISGSLKHLESFRLERYMNANANKKTWDITPSFDWSSVPFAYPPPPNLPLPKPGRAPGLPRVQFAFSEKEPWAAREAREARRREVRRVFRRGWQSYRERAWLRDALLPVSGGGRDQFSGWAATLVDALDTLWIMGLREEFDEAVEAVAGIDFSVSSGSQRVNMFETNIRYLGGLLAAYDLSRRSVLLAKAIELGDMLFAGFNTEHRMPVDFFNLEASKEGKGLPVEGAVVSASPGTLWLEFVRLSQVTGDAKYYTAVEKVIALFEQGQDKTALPGLWPTMVSMNNRDVTTGSGFTLGSGADSLYEYVTKMYPMVGGRDQRYKSMSLKWMAAADKHMFYRPMLPGGEDLLFAGNTDLDGSGTPNLDPESEHLSCFLGGTYAMGGRLFGRNDLIDIGVKLGKGCAYSYAVTATGMGPERWNMVKCADRDRCVWDDGIWVEEKAKKGHQWKESAPLGFTTCKDPRYILRPEAIESIFYLYRITGQQEYQDIAWNMFVAVSNGTETEYANAAVKDVTSTERPLAKDDYMEVSG